MWFLFVLFNSIYSQKMVEHKWIFQIHKWIFQIHKSFIILNLIILNVINLIVSIVMYVYTYKMIVSNRVCNSVLLLLVSDYLWDDFLNYITKHIERIVVWSFVSDSNLDFIFLKHFERKKLDVLIHLIYIFLHIHT